MQIATWKVLTIIEKLQTPKQLHHAPLSWRTGSPDSFQVSTTVHKLRSPHRGSFTCSLCCRHSRESGIVFRFLPHAFYTLSAPPHTRFLPPDPSRPNVTRDIFRTLLVSRFLPPSRQRKPLSCLLAGSPPPGFLVGGLGSPLAQARQRCSGSTTSQDDLPLRLCAKARGRPRRAGARRRREERGPASRLGTLKPRRANQPSVVSPS